MHVPDGSAEDICVLLSICGAGVCSTEVVPLKSSSGSAVVEEAALLNAIDKRLPVEMIAPTRPSEMG
jgi:hypothetical protein